MNANVEGAVEKQKENAMSTAAAKAIIATLNDIAPDDQNGEELFAALLAMSDEDFDRMAPLFMVEVEKAFSDPTACLQLANIINLSGQKYEDMVQSYTDLLDELDAEVSDDMLSPNKKAFFKVVLATVMNAIGETQAVTKRIVEIPIQLDENAKIPAYANAGDAGADLYASESYDLGPGEQALIKTGIKVAIPNGYALLIQPRSGLSSKSKLRICNTPGLIDSGYRGEICVIMENTEAKIKDLDIDGDGRATGLLYGSSYHIEAGDRIAQMRLVEVPTAAFTEVADILSYESERGEGGFGSTGMK